MEHKQYLQIGEICKICDISIQALRYWDKTNFLKPAYIDQETNYRYYTKEQIFTITNTKLLRAVGFTLSEIKTFLEKKSINDITELLQNKVNEIDKKVQDLLLSKNRITSHIDSFASIMAMPKNIKISKNIEPSITLSKERKILFTRDKVAFTYKSIIMLYNQLIRTAFDNSLQMHGNLMLIFHDNYENINFQNADIELAIEISSNIDEVLPFIRTFKQQEYITCLHKGKYPTCLKTYSKMKEFAFAKGYTFSSTVIHSLIVPIAVAKSSDDIVYEIQIPLTK